MNFNPPPSVPIFQRGGGSFSYKLSEESEESEEDTTPPLCRGGLGGIYQHKHLLYNNFFLTVGSDAERGNDIYSHGPVLSG